MKNFRFSFPAILLAGFFIYSCNAADNEARKMERPDNYKNEKSSANADSAAFSKTPYEEQETAPGEHAVDGQDQLKDKNPAAAFFSDENEVQNDAYRDFVHLISSTAARPTRLDSTHRFVRTADLKFRAKNVADATYHIEDVTAKFGGYVADTKLASNLEASSEKPVSADSSLETMHYIVTNNITLRVPSEKLDSVLKSLVPLIDYLDYRNISMHDITLDLLANKLAQKRIFNYNARLSNDIDTKGKKLDDVQSAEQSMLNQQANSDNALIENLRQDDQVRYSTVTIYLYQRETIRQELVKREKNIDEYEPGMGAQMSEALQAGWHGLRAVIMVLCLLWPLWLSGIGIYFFVKWLIRKNAKAGK